MYVVASKSSRNSLVLFTGIVSVIKEMYTDILRRLTDATGRKRPGKRRTSSWFLLHDNAPAHRSVFAMYFLAKNNVTALEHLLYSSDLDPGHVYLFPPLKSAVKGQRLYDATDIIKNETEELKRLSKNGLAYIIILFCISLQCRDSGNILKLPHMYYKVLAY